jgi:RNA polymerase sigma-70 factor (ECF subfamily)
MGQKTAARPLAGALTCIGARAALAVDAMTMPLDAATDIDDASLLAQYANGDRSAARMLTQRLTPVVFAQAFRLLGEQAEAEDVTQEALIRLWRIAPEWDADRAKVTTWLYRVTANLCVDRLRKRGRMEPGLDEVSEPTDPTPGAEMQVQHASRMKALRAALCDLPERQRDAVILRHLEELSNPEIAARLDVSVEAVESLVSRGKRALKTRLQGLKDALGYENDG